MSIPIELLEEILRCGWLSPMFMQERIAFITSVALVSKLWLETLIRIISRDVYIPSTPYRQFNVGRSPFLHKFLPKLPPTQLCHTITQQIPLSRKTTKHGRLSSLSKRKSIRELLSTFYGLPIMPNLRTLTVEHYNLAAGENHSFPFRAPIVQLHLEYTFTSDCPCWLIDALLASRHSKSKHLPWTLPHLEHISTPVNEDPVTSIVKVLDSCPHLRLAEERFTIRVRVLSSSRHVLENCTIVHGVSVMPSFDGCDMNYHEFGPRTIRASALALVLMTGGDRACGPLVDLANTFRNVHVFVHKNE
ncbi:hypothetical protein BYT27DRAFT_7074545 [Phlegmacium glaucopus]|nr:hypothetical protein BYT27DRAFT_7074545 [Phlegmacium glaucopus]